MQAICIVYADFNAKCVHAHVNARHLRGFRILSTFHRLLIPFLSLKTFADASPRTLKPPGLGE
eukprot:m.133064 g.133064  ORF g.133064 m.133064 type:complete len:63 (+) comp38099_c0_seq9:266-454(+)